MHKSDISTEQPADQMQRELLPDSTEMSGALPPCSFLSVLLKLTLSCAFLGKLGKGSWLPSPLNFTSWQSSVPLRHSKHTHTYCHKWLAIILPHRMQSKPRFWSKPFITFKNHPLQFSFYFPFPLGHIISSFSRLPPLFHRDKTWRPLLWYQSSSHRTDTSTCLVQDLPWLGAEFQQGWKHNPSGADSHSWTLKHNALISRSACSYKSNGFNASRACQCEQEETAVCPCVSHWAPLKLWHSSALTLLAAGLGSWGACSPAAPWPTAAPPLHGCCQDCWNIAPESKFQESKHYH